MTAPVLMEMEDDYRPFWETVVYPMSFLLPAEHQENPPKPTDNKVSCRMRLGIVAYHNYFS